MRQDSFGEPIRSISKEAKSLGSLVQDDDFETIIQLIANSPTSHVEGAGFRVILFSRDISM